MTITQFFDHSITVKRLSSVGGNKTAFSTVTATSGHRQNLAEDEVQIIDGATNKSYKIWCDIDEDINEGDRLVIDNTDFEVISKEKKDYGMNQHLELVCNQIDQGGQ